MYGYFSQIGSPIHRFNRCANGGSGYGTDNNRKPLGNLAEHREIVHAAAQEDCKRGHLKDTAVRFHGGDDNRDKHAIDGNAQRIANICRQNISTDSAWQRPKRPSKLGEYGKPAKIDAAYFSFPAHCHCKNLICDGKAKK